METRNSFLKRFGALLVGTVMAPIALSTIHERDKFFIYTFFTNPEKEKIKDNNYYPFFPYFGSFIKEVSSFPGWYEYDIYRDIDEYYYCLGDREYSRERYEEAKEEGFKGTFLDYNIDSMLWMHHDEFSDCHDHDNPMYMEFWHGKDFAGRVPYITNFFGYKENQGMRFLRFIA